ncbi:MAG: type II secretion system F family protein [Methanoregula sp.]|jgi:flagellar protein FlaJ|nr:type II secretion system F family protein [Methanoregula sp.]
MNTRYFVRKWIQHDPNRYSHLHADLVSVRTGLTLEQFLWRSIKLAFLGGFLFALLGFFISTNLTLQIQIGKVGIYNIFNIQVPAILSTAAGIVTLQVFVVLGSFILGTYIVYSLLLRIPGIKKRNRETKINLTLHNAVAYMYAMRKGGAQLMTIFRSLSDRADIYGEVALDFRQIVRDADFFGYDIVTAIRHLADTTPSEKLKDFLEDLLSVIESGGNMAEFLSMRVRIYQEEARFEQKQFLTLLSLVAESYVTLFVAGPLFLIIIMVVMGMMGGSAVLQLTLVTYAIMPVGSVVFILFIHLISVNAEKTERYIRTTWLRTYSDVKIYKKSDEESLFEQLKKYDRLRNLVFFIRHPLESFIKNVNLSLYVTIPVATLYIVIVFLQIPQYTNIEIFFSIIDDHIVIALLIVLIPYAIFYEIWARKILGIQELIPDFLERMSGINQVGLTIAQAISIMINANLGLISYEIKRIKRDMDWGANFTEALVRFEERVRAPSIARTVTLITKASEMSGHIGEVLSIASIDAKMTEMLKKERLAEMFIYTAIIYLSFFVFLFVVGVLTTQFLPVLANISTQGLPSTGVLSGIGSIPIATFGRLLYHACLVQAFFSGLIAGQMGESSLAAGVKHACVLLVISLVAFNFILV